MEKTRKNKVLAFMTVLCVMLCVVGCGNTQLSDTFDEQEVITEVKQVITDLSNERFDAVEAVIREDLQESLSAEALKEAVEKTFPEAGALSEFDSVTIVGQESEGEQYAVAVVAARYENQTVSYTITFNKDMRIVGFFMK